jgi:hypothetical protein
MSSGTWLGSLMVLIHAGIHFNAILPWLATIAMGVNVISGMVGKIPARRLAPNTCWASASITSCVASPNRKWNRRYSGMQ